MGMYNWIDFFWMTLFEYCRGSMDGGGAQAVPARIAEGRERRLERNIEKLREDSHANAGCKPCSEVLPPPLQSQPPPPQI
jgi:hypothetical protein